MKRSKTTGWKQVYQFTLIQTIKSKSIRIMTLILCTAALLSMPIMQVVNSLTQDTEESPIKTVYIVDESGLGEVDYTSISTTNEQYKNLTFVNADKSVEEITEDLKKTDDGSILLSITANEGNYNLHFIKAPKGSITDTDMNTLSEFILDNFNKNRILTLGITEEQMKVINATITTEVNNVSSAGTGSTEDGGTAGDKEILSFNEYSMAMFVVVVIIMFLAFGAEAVASSIITEKSTRVIEFLMTSIRPLAIIIGKVLAMLTVTLLQFVLLGTSLVISLVISGAIFPSSDSLSDKINGFLTPEVLSNLTPINLILTILIFIGGFMFFALFAGLTGATVSRIEELAEGIMISNGVMVVGAYLGMAVYMMNMAGNSGGVFAYVVYLLPVSSIFITPIYLFLGKITVVWGFAALLVLILSLIGLSIFTAKIYEVLILHQGNRLKIRDLISISKSVSKEAKGEQYNEKK